MCAFFFFFQAEDGIRDKLVTGVQTCALPITEGRVLSARDSRRGHARMRALLAFHIAPPATPTELGRAAVAGTRHLGASCGPSDGMGTGIAPLVAAPVTFSMARDLRIARRAE